MSITVDRIVTSHARRRAARRHVWTVVLVSVGLSAPAAIGLVCDDGCLPSGFNADVDANVHLTVRLRLQIGQQVRETARIFGGHLSTSD